MQVAPFFLKNLTPGRVIVYLSTIANLAIAVLIVVTGVHARSGNLQAQEDFGVFILTIGVSGSAALICLITLVVEGTLKIRSAHFGEEMLKNPVIGLGVLNCVAPFVQVVALIWLIRG